MSLNPFENNNMEEKKESMKLGKFPADISNESNKNHGDLKTIIFRNYIPSDQDMKKMTEEIDHFKRVGKIEKLYEKKVTKVSP